MKERCNERCGRGDQQRQIIRAVFPDLLFERNHRRNRWLDHSVQLGHRQGSKLDVGLVQISDVLSELYYPAADRDPERKVYFEGDPHRASPHF